MRTTQHWHVTLTWLVDLFFILIIIIIIILLLILLSLLLSLASWLLRWRSGVITDWFASAADCDAVSFYSAFDRFCCCIFCYCDRVRRTPLTVDVDAEQFLVELTFVALCGGLRVFQSYWRRFCGVVLTDLFVKLWFCRSVEKGLLRLFKVLCCSSLQYYNMNFISS